MKTRLKRIKENCFLLRVRIYNNSRMLQNFQSKFCLLRRWLITGCWILKTGLVHLFSTLHVIWRWILEKNFSTLNQGVRLIRLVLSFSFRRTTQPGVVLLLTSPSQDYTQALKLIHHFPLIRLGGKALWGSNVFSKNTKLCSWPGFRQKQ